MTPNVFNNLNTYDITNMKIKKESLCSTYFTEFSVSRFKFIEELIIGDDCCSYVAKFDVSHLMFLTTVKIGQNSFTQQKNGYGGTSSKSFTINSCAKLKYISIGRYSFSDFGGSFTIQDCPSLTTLIIGDVSSVSYCFYSCSFILTCKPLFLCCSNVALPALTEIQIGGQAFCDCFTVSFNTLKNLQKIRLGEEAFEGSFKEDSSVSFVSIFILFYDSYSIDLPVLRSISSSGSNFNYCRTIAVKGEQQGLFLME